jgi:hypothetical protein
MTGVCPWARQNFSLAEMAVTSREDAAIQGTQREGEEGEGFCKGHGCIRLTINE